ncbi:PilZ domain-containing protein [Gimesia fumaroli]|jgi:c-di-GMP-binding flagellar brake protein YcgR|uniref:PilZ domain protein n=1 Tax=Gimesia fumaroli TaxID=2527976 RepID=A0A518IK86_9PLAN|nr:PilZ domain-containing protein [Gimesia fumaroli]QDV53469.1 PilZ domain protein [Gimesia fumaroli]
MTDRRKSTSRRSGNERRQYQRTKFETEVSLLRSGSSSGQGPINGTLYDVSSNGIRIRLDLPLSIGESLLVQVHNSGKHLFNSTAKVVWQEQDQTGKYSTGCELCVLLTEKQEKTLSEFIEQKNNLHDLLQN